MLHKSHVLDPLKKLILLEIFEKKALLFVRDLNRFWDWCSTETPDLSGKKIEIKSDIKLWWLWKVKRMKTTTNYFCSTTLKIQTISSLFARKVVVDSTVPIYAHAPYKLEHLEPHQVHSGERKVFQHCGRKITFGPNIRNVIDKDFL